MLTFDERKAVLALLMTMPGSCSMADALVKWLGGYEAVVMRKELP